LIERVAEWVLQCARETSGPPARLAEHHRYLREYVLPPWAAFGVSEDILNRVEAVPAMLQHNDLWSANIVMSATDLTVIDWEEVRPDSLPLWDLLYFFADAFAMLDGKRFAPLDERVAYFVKLFRGELPSSRLVFEWVRRAARESAIPPEALGHIATLLWLQKGYRPWAGRHDGPPEERPLKARLAHAWLGDPALGTGWSA
jgi:thiamine kinase-like enzyme